MSTFSSSVDHLIKRHNHLDIKQVFEIDSSQRHKKNQCPSNHKIILPTSFFIYFFLIVKIIRFQ